MKQAKRIFTLKERLNIWTYWESTDNKKMPAYLELCFETIKNQCINSNIHLVTPDNINEYINKNDLDLDQIKLQDKNKNPVSLKTDFLRVKLLHDYGGLWLDIDCIVLTDIGHQINNYLKSYEFIGMQKYSKSPPYVTNNFMASRKEGAVIKKYLEQISQKIKFKLSMDEEFSWSEIGSSMLTPIINDNSISPVLLLAEEQIHPFDFTEAEVLEREKKPQDRIIYLSKRINDDTKCVMLYNALHSNEFKSLNKNEVLQSNCIIGDLINYSLGHESILSL